MITTREKMEAQSQAAELIQKAAIHITAAEIAGIEVADFGLSRVRVEGAQILTWLQTDRIGVKILVLLPGQTLPEHWHPQVGDDPGKEETVRHLHGDLYIVVEGEDTMKLSHLPEGNELSYSCRHEIVPQRGEQITFAPLAKHWFQAGPAGAVAFSFSSVVRDALDGFTDSNVQRITVVSD